MKFGPGQQKQIAFTTDKRGNVLAYEWRMYQFRYFRVSLEGAKLDIATGRARQVSYVRGTATSAEN